MNILNKPQTPSVSKPKHTRATRLKSKYLLELVVVAEKKGGKLSRGLDTELTTDKTDQKLGWMDSRMR